MKKKTAETGLLSLEHGQDFLRENFPQLSEETFNYFFHDVTSMLQHHGAKDLPEKYRLSSDAYFQLLEHEELEEARASSRQALHVAIGAICISIFTALASIGVQIYQLRTPADVVVSDQQVEQILSVATAPRHVVLDQSQFESLLKSGERPKNVILAPAQSENDQ